MGQSLDEIGTAIPLCGLLGNRHEGMARVEERVPKHHQPPLIERKTQLGRRVWHRHGSKAEKISLDRERIGIRYISVAGVRHGRIEMGAVMPDAFAKGSDELDV